MEIMMKHISAKAAIFFSLLMLSSCLDKVPGDYVPVDRGMETVTDAEEIVNGIYNTFKSGSLYSGRLTLCPDIQADLVHAVQGNSNTYVNLWQWDILPGNADIEAVYAGLYMEIGRAHV